MNTKAGKYSPGIAMRLTLTLLCVFSLNVNYGQVYQGRSAFLHEPDSIISESWMEVDSRWRAEGKVIFTYDSVQNTKSSISSRRDELSSAWILTSKSDIYYGSNGKDSLEIYSEWYNPPKKWFERSKTRYTYNSHGYNIQIASQNFDDELQDWVDFDRKDIFYNNDGKDTLEIRNNWSVQSGWTASYKTRYIYDENGNNILSYLYSWDQTDYNKWLLYSKVENTFDPNGNVIRTLPSDWDLSGGQWLPPHYKHEYTYDENGKMISDSSSLWIEDSQDTGHWISTLKNEYEYNDEASLSRLLTFTSDGLSSWIILSRSVYYYPGQDVTVVPGVPGQKIAVYPNPSRRYVTFDLPDISVSAHVEIWDMEGRKLLDQVLPENRTLNVSSLAKGMYICRIKSDGIVYSCKIVKEDY
jgi:hypothetical protein